jgi:hypothetical protein
MEPPTTTARDSRPVLFGPTGDTLMQTPQPPGRLAIWWEWIRLHIDSVSKVASTMSSVLLVVWSIGLFVGGLILLFYYSNIGFIPELDLKASVTLLAVSAITGSFLFLMVIAILLFPSAIWINMLRRSDPLKRFLSDQDGKLLYRRLSLWLIFPVCFNLIGFSACGILWVSGIGRSWIWWVGMLCPVLASGGILAWRLYQKLPEDLDPKEKRKAIEIFLGNLLQCTFFFLICLLMLNPLMISALTPVMPASYPDMATKLFLAALTFATCGIAFFDALMVHVFFESPDWRLLMITALVVLLISFLSPLGFFTYITDTVMSMYKFGNVHNTSLVLDESGCTIAKYHGFQPATVLKEQTCRLDCVKILSRLGSAYYLDAGHQNNLSTRFTIPAQNVISWSLPSKAVLDSCAAKSSSSSGSGSQAPSP